MYLSSSHLSFLLILKVYHMIWPFLNTEQRWSYYKKLAIFVFSLACIILMAYFYYRHIIHCDSMGKFFKMFYTIPLVYVMITAHTRKRRIIFAAQEQGILSTLKYSDGRKSDWFPILVWLLSVTVFQCKMLAIKALVCAQQPLSVFF